MRRYTIAAIIGALILTACGSTSSPAASNCSKTWKVGLVTDVGKLSDKSFNYDSYQGVVNAQHDSSLCVQGRAIESTSENDYPKNIGLFVQQNYDAIVTVGFKLGDATIAAAKANPSIKFIMVDNADFADKTPPSNLLGLLFKEDQPGFLAGALAGLMTKTNKIGYVAGLQSVPPVVHYVEGYKNGAKKTNPNVTVLGIYQPESGAKDFNDPDWGKQQALTFFGQGADIVFGVGGNTGNGALVAAKEQGKICIGVDVDQYLSYTQVDSCLLTSAEKHLDIAVKAAVADVVHGTFQPGVKTFDISNNGIGLAPYHEWDSKVPANVKTQISQLQDGLKNGTISTGVSS
ncbi:MAG: BMP family ABC transporter substrate-binding protein [Chloroflexi bacterium]|nr:MAG: BMP family ABC transporter substrate-binding protein [Chloroflexota bacterium]